MSRRTLRRIASLRRLKQKKALPCPAFLAATKQKAFAGGSSYISAQAFYCKERHDHPVLKNEGKGADTSYSQDLEVDTVQLTEEKTQLKKPSRYSVVMLDDDYTPMEFVVCVIEKIFHKAREEATRIMLDVHNKGRATVGSYTHDVALSKVEQVHNLAEQDQHPLQCVLEAERNDA